MKKYLIYKIINSLNNMIYIGCHVTENINDKYMGSGTLIKKAIKKYGLENFDKQILYVFDNELEMLEKEKELVNREFISQKNNYNVIIGGNNFLTIDTIPVVDKEGNYFRVHRNDERLLSGELIHNTKNTISIKDKNGNYFRVDKNDERYISGELVGVNKGKITMKDKNGNTFFVNANDDRYLKGELNHLWTNKKHTEESKRKISEKNSLNQKGNKNSQFGTCWITKNGENKKIKKEFLEDYLKDDWIKGRKI